MSRQQIAIFGSTGSIGTNALAIVDAFPEKFEVVVLTAGRNLTLLREQIARFRPSMVCVQESSAVAELSSQFPRVEFVSSEEGLIRCAGQESVQTVVMGIVGFAALAPTLEAIRSKKTVALANKESLVVAGALLRREIEGSRARVIPVDSEHNAIHQLLLGTTANQVASIVLTASGGPLLRRPELPLAEVTPEIAVRHPNWKMGPKISVDSATLMNKGLEVIEAHFLFDFPSSKIEVWVHPQSIVHGAIWLTDNSCLAQLSKPDMRSSIGFAMSYPERLEKVIPKLSFADFTKLEFYEPDTKRFPALRLARQALDAGPSHLVALNAANEIVVGAFLGRQLLFSQIPDVIERVLSEHVPVPVLGIEDIFVLDRNARETTQNLCTKLGKQF